MSTSLPPISLAQLALAFLPVAVSVAILFRWSHEGRTAVYAILRMLVQLLLIGYVLAFIFRAEHSIIVMLVLAMMLSTASWISLRPLKASRLRLLPKALGAIAIGGGATLALITQGVLDLQPWFSPRYLIPLAGMTFANAMNTISVAGERIEAEMNAGAEFGAARAVALRAGLIPLTNSLLAVGLVAIPGLMTGQILSGVSPQVAARYQIMVMCMVYGSAGISTAIFLNWIESNYSSAGLNA